MAAAPRPLRDPGPRCGPGSVLPHRKGAELGRRWGELAAVAQGSGVLLKNPVPLAVRPAARCGRASRRPARVGVPFKKLVERDGKQLQPSLNYRAVLTPSVRAGADAVRGRLGVACAGCQSVSMPVYWHNRVGLPPRRRPADSWRRASTEPLAGLFKVGPVTFDHRNIARPEHWFEDLTLARSSTSTRAPRPRRCSPPSSRRAATIIHPLRSPDTARRAAIATCWRTDCRWRSRSAVSGHLSTLASVNSLISFLEQSSHAS